MESLSTSQTVADTMMKNTGIPFGQSQQSDEHARQGYYQLQPNEKELEEAKACIRYMEKEIEKEREMIAAPHDKDLEAERALHAKDLETEHGLPVAMVEAAIEEERALRVGVIEAAIDEKCMPRAAAIEEVIEKERALLAARHARELESLEQRIRAELTSVRNGSSVLQAVFETA